VYVSAYGDDHHTTRNALVQLHRAQGMMGSPVSVAESSAPPDEVADALVMQLTNMGFDHQTARNALESAGWSIGGAVAVLFG
jgi:hypothetical protein